MNSLNKKNNIEEEKEYELNSKTFIKYIKNIRTQRFIILILMVVTLGMIVSNIDLSNYIWVVLLLLDTLITLKYPVVEIFIYHINILSIALLLLKQVPLVVNSPYTSENPKIVNFYVILAIILALVYLILRIIFVLNRKFRSKGFSMVLPYVFLFISMFMLFMFPYIANYIVNI